ncbi:MAG TPA: hypothetical protein VMW50_13450 [Dehalococcoidia bacterium]|nr:hypothetical protein [Dehalococcoidia bacterium]
MTSRKEYQASLRSLDRDIQICISYLEETLNDRFKTALVAQEHKPQKVDLSKIESKMDSLQKQIDGLRPKVDAAYSFVQEHDEQEKYLKKLTKNAEEVLDGVKQHFEELYKSGYFSEGTRRKIRDEGLIDQLKAGK